MLIGDVEAPELPGLLDRLSCELIRTDAISAVDTAARWGSVNVALFDPQVLADDRGERLVTELRSAYPSMRAIVLGDAAAMGSAVLVRAMHAGLQNVVDPADTIGLRNWMERCLDRSEEGVERVLAIGAHPDDVEIGCAGALLDHRRRGDHVTVLTLSPGNVGGDALQRVGESADAARSLGARLVVADLPDTRIDPGIETIRIVEEVVSRVDPTVVYVHSKHDNHQDHRAVHTATMSATRRVQQVYAYQSPSATNDFTPTRFVPIDLMIARKVEVLASFASQSERSYLEPEMVVAGARYWARHLAPLARYAEPMEVIRSLAGRGAILPRPLRESAAAPVVPMPMIAGAAVGGG